MKLERLRGSIHKVATGCLGDYFQKVISIPPDYIVIELMVLFERIQHVSADTLWIHCLRNHNEITMYLLNKCLFPPVRSVRAIRRGPRIGSRDSGSSDRQGEGS